jgi:predicted chitinase
MPITKDQLKKVAPRPSQAAKARIWDAYVDAIVSPAGHAAMAEFGIETGRDVCHFIANIAEETGGFTIVAESGAYTAPRIMEVFGVGRHSAKVTEAEARVFAAMAMPKREMELFERVYGLGNPKKAAELGNTRIGDGWRFKGRSNLQTTGKSAYAAVGRHIGVDLVAKPELLEDPVNGLRAAGWEWREKGCGTYARQDNARMVRRLINGGYNGIDVVEAYLAKAKKQWWEIPTVIDPALAPPAAVEVPVAAVPAGKTAPAAQTSAQAAAIAMSVAVPGASVAVAAAVPAAPVAPAPVPGAPAPAPVSPAATYIAEHLRPGDVGAAVKGLQTELSRLGYWTGDIDGDFGPRTVEALLAFKADPRHNPPLPLDTEVDPAVWAALIVAKPRDMGPRALITPAEAVQRSEAASMFASIGSWGRAIYRTVLAFFGIDVTSQAAGIDLLDVVTTNAGKLAAFLAKLDLPAGLASPHVLLLIGLAIIASAGWVIARRASFGLKAKVKDIRAGAVLGTAIPAQSA